MKGFDRDLDLPEGILVLMIRIIALVGGRFKAILDVDDIALITEGILILVKVS